MKKVHRLKINPKYINDVFKNGKSFEIRKDDRGYNVGDVLILKEFENGKYTGKYLNVEITYLLRDIPEYGLKEGYVVLGIR